MKEILKYEDEANNIIYDAKKNARQIEAKMENEIEKITNDLENEFNDRVKILKATIQKKQEEEEKRLKKEFEENEKKLKQIDPKIIEEMIDLVIKKLCGAKTAIRHCRIA